MSNKSGSGRDSLIGLIIIILCIVFWSDIIRWLGIVGYIILSFITLCVIALIVRFILWLIRRKKGGNYVAKQVTTHYKKKEHFMSLSEQEFYLKLFNATGEQYYIFPQVPLSSVVEKISNERWQSELYRTCDFGLFDKDFGIVALIEYNDQTHYLPERVKRDKTVQSICAEAGIPLVTFWTHDRDGNLYPNEISYIRNRIDSFINSQQTNN